MVQTLEKVIDLPLTPMNGNLYFCGIIIIPKSFKCCSISGFMLFFYFDTLFLCFGDYQTGS